MISVFGSTGFIGSKWMQKYPDISVGEERDCLCCLHDKILYFRGTTTNYNIFDKPLLDIETNLDLFVKTLKYSCTGPETEFNLISSWFVNYPHGFYSATKLCQEHLLECYCKTFDHKYRIIRLCNVVGGDKGKSKQKNALEFYIDKLKNGEDFSIYEGNNFRNYINVDDCCTAIKLILDNGELNTMYEIGDKQSYRFPDLIEYCRNKLNSKSKIDIIETPKFHKTVQIKDYHADTSKLYDLGFKPKFNIYQTLDLLCQQPI